MRRGRQTEAWQPHQELAVGLSQAALRSRSEAAGSGPTHRAATKDFECAWKETEGRYEAAVRDRAAEAEAATQLAGALEQQARGFEQALTQTNSELETTRAAADAFRADASDRLQSLETDRTRLERACLDVLARLKAATGEGAALMAERDALRQALSAAQDEAHVLSQQQMAVADRAKVVEIRAVEEQFASQLTQERAAAALQSDALATLHQELAVARRDAEAARQRADALEQRQKSLRKCVGGDRAAL